MMVVMMVIMMVMMLTMIKGDADWFVAMFIVLFIG
jgi:hypothetical protein